MLSDVPTMLSEDPTMLSEGPTMLSEVSTMLSEGPIMLSEIPAMLSVVPAMLSEAGGGSGPKCLDDMPLRGVGTQRGFTLRYMYLSVTFFRENAKF